MHSHRFETLRAGTGDRREPSTRSGVCRLVGPSGAIARVVSSVLLVTRQASGRVRAFAMSRPGMHGGAGLAPAVGLIGSSAFVA
jgi:hypothetical protein